MTPLEVSNAFSSFPRSQFNKAKTRQSRIQLSTSKYTEISNDGQFPDIVLGEGALVGLPQPILSLFK